MVNGSKIYNTIFIILTDRDKNTETNQKSETKNKKIKNETNLELRNNCAEWTCPELENNRAERATNQKAEHNNNERKQIG